MIDIKDFKVNKVVLFTCIMQIYMDMKRDLGRIKNDVVRTDSQNICDRFFEFLENNEKQKNYFLGICENFEDRYKEVEENEELMELLTGVFETEEFGRIYDGTIEYRDTMLRQLSECRELLDEYLVGQLGITGSKDISVNVLNPYFCTGISDLHSEVFWGHYRGLEDPNYNIVYLVHECMHCEYPYQKDWNREQRNTCHALIELATDNELRCRLEGKHDTYSEGHDLTIIQRGKMLPLWCAFLGKTEEEVEQLKKCKDIDLDIDMYRLFSSKKEFQNMSFSEFIIYCVEHCQELDPHKKFLEELQVDVQPLHGDAVGQIEGATETRENGIDVEDREEQ